MKYKAEIKSYGAGSGIVISAEDEFLKEEWLLDYQPLNHTLVMRRYYLYSRKTKRHGWKITDIFGGWNKRSDTLSEMPPVPNELREMAIKEWGRITIGKRNE